MIEKSCDKCEKQIEFKKLKKIRGKYICKDCVKKNRQERREETINNSGIKEDLKKLDRKIKVGYQRKYQRKIRDKKRSEKKEIDKTYTPKIKRSTTDKKKEKSSAYMPFEEKKRLLSILVKRGMEFEEAKERLKNLVKEQVRVREFMKQKNKSEDEIKIKQQELIEEMWNY